MAWKKYIKKWAKKSSMKKRATGNYKAASQSKDTASLVIKVPYTFGMTIGNAQSQTALYDYATAICILKQLGQNSVFTKFAQIFDQVRICGVRVKIQQTQGNATYQNANAPLQIVTAWDRNGLSKNADGSIVPVTFNDVKANGSCKMKLSPYGSYYHTTRSIYPSTMDEKSQLISTFDLITTTSGDTYPVENQGIPFNPTLYFAIKTPIAVPAGSVVDVAAFTAEISISCEFRGIRYIQ